MALIRPIKSSALDVSELSGFNLGTSYTITAGAAKNVLITVISSGNIGSITATNGTVTQISSGTSNYAFKQMLVEVTNTSSNCVITLAEEYRFEVTKLN